MSIDVVPADLRPLLDLPLFVHLATVRPDNTAQVNPMWFKFDGEFLKFTHTTKRGKYRNLQANPSMAVSMLDPEDPERYLEVRGRLAKVEPDPTGAFYVELGQWYGNPDEQPPANKADRVVLFMSLEKATRQG